MMTGVAGTYEASAANKGRRSLSKRDYRPLWLRDDAGTWVCFERHLFGIKDRALLLYEPTSVREDEL